MAIVLPDYNIPPAGTLAQFQQIADTLATWLPAGTKSALLPDWTEAEWQIAEWLALWQNALPWFVARLEQQKIAVPSVIWERLRIIDQDSRLRTQQMLQNSVEILEALGKANIPAMPLKGIVLAACYYRDPLIRPLGDLDIFIKANDSKKAGTILNKMGYTFLKRTAKEDVFAYGSRQSHPFSPKNIRPVELQYQALNEYGGLVHNLAELLWQTTVEKSLWNGVNCLVPKPATLFHHLIAHATEDWLMGRGKLMEINDIYTLAKAMSAADWQMFQAGLTPAGARFLYPALIFANHYLTLPVPPTIMTFLAQNTPPQLQKWLETIRPGQLLESKAQNLAWHEYQVAQLLTRSLADKSRTYFRLLFPPRWHFRMNKYPALVASPFWPLCYLLINGERVAQLFKKG